MNLFFNEKNKSTLPKKKFSIALFFQKSLFETFQTFDKWAEVMKEVWKLQNV